MGRRANQNLSARRRAWPGLARALGALALVVAAGAAPAGPPLTADQAFQPSVERVDARHLRVRWAVADGYYLYRKSLQIELVDAGAAAVARVDLPAGKVHNDAYFGEVRTLRERVTAGAMLSQAVTAANARLRLSYRGCADAGLCYPPQTKTVSLPGVASDRPESPDAGAASQAAAPGAGPDAQVLPSATARIAAGIDSGSVFVTLALFLGLGVVLAFSPCGLPMLPIIAGAVAGSGVTARRALALSAVYVLAMGAAYALLGAVAGYLGANLQVVLQQPAVIAVFAAVFVVLALASFGAFELALPVASQQRLGAFGRRRGGLAGAAVLGFAAALIAGPCLAPPLAGAFLYIADTGHVALGAGALFALGLGMGLPLVLVATFGAGVLPRAGAWMVQTRALAGVVLLGVAWWLASRLIAPGAALLGWAALALGYGAYLSTRAPLATAARAGQRAGVFVLFVYAASALVGASIGGGRPLAPLAGLAPGAGGGATTTARRAFTRVTTLAGLEDALTAARRAGRPAVVDFYADWCVECVRAQRTVFARQDVRQALGRVAAIQVDVTASDREARRVLAYYDVFGPPTVLFFNAAGRRLSGRRLVGALEAGVVLGRVRRLAGSRSTVARADNVAK